MSGPRLVLDNLDADPYQTANMTDPLDIRIRERLMRKGKLSGDFLQKHIAELPDRAPTAEWIDYEAKFEAERLEVEAKDGSGGHLGEPS